MEFIRSHKLIVATIAIQLIVLPLILLAVKERQQVTTKAVAATTLFFNPQLSVGNVGQDLSYDLMVDPGTNLVSLIKVEILYDSTKFSLASSNPVVVNSQAFPVTIEGPVTSTPGKVQVVVSVGPDQTRVIQTETKVLTLNLRAIATANNTQISIGPITQVFSIAPQDTSTENVLSTTGPATVTLVAGSTPTPTPTTVPVTNTPTPTSPPSCVNTTPASFTVTPTSASSLQGGNVTYQVTVTNHDTGSCAPRTPTLQAVLPTGITGGFNGGTSLTKALTIAAGQSVVETLTLFSSSQTPAASYSITINLRNTSNAVIDTANVTYVVQAAAVTPTLTPTPNTPTPTPTIAPTATILNFTGLKLHGLGKGGDNPNPTSDGTLNPLRPNRDLTVEIYNTSGTLVNTVTGNITYSGSQTGVFNGSVTLPSTINSGDYLIKIKSQYYLRRQLPGFMSLVKGQSNNAPATSLIAGDVDNDNLLEADHDYNLIMDCYSDLQAPRNCDANKKIAADISDDGKVNYDDYNLFLRELSVQAGD